MPPYLLPLDHETRTLRRLAARAGLTFHVDPYGMLTEHAGWKSETRLATGPERELWARVVPWVIDWDEDAVFDATPAELQNLDWKGNAFYINARDFGTIRRMDGFVATFDRNELLDLKVGTYRRGCAVYVSREVPPGYALPARVEGLHWRPPPGPRTIRPPLSYDDQIAIQMGLVDLSA